MKTLNIIMGVAIAIIATAFLLAIRISYLTGERKGAGEYDAVYMEGYTKGHSDGYQIRGIYER